MMSTGLFGSSATEEYRRYRKAGMGLNHKIIEAFVDGEVIEEAARALGLGRDRRLVLDSEDDLSVLMDFALYELWWQGRTLVERYRQEKGGRGAIEGELLAAMVKAQTGLFRVEDVLQQQHHLILRGLGEEERVITLTDINFSRTMVVGLLVFFRPIELAKFTMTSGTAFAYPQAMEQVLSRRWERKWKGASSAKRYADLFKLSKRKGLSTRYA